ncbi:hypothetical protein OIDMADRAFT_48617 [Oidiodendron maius Zn]|uniref:ABM domain-containing protein n=1 Tax=Oidiodendron maius (strain Zn) TaxID=913774 RepID=A0A0C3DBQ7_OIDMZ|nr:hypothetical protein OIDMADRAFT_48617 [Oidiodendron maius Zn]
MSPERFRQTVSKGLDEDSGCNGWWISPSIENPQHQILLINWKSVDAHHEAFEKAPGFQQCIDALEDYYGEFVIPSHVVGLKPIFEGYL